MRILLTGSSGFIGNAFLRLAIKNGHEIGALLLPELNTPSGLESHPQIKWLHGSLDSAPWNKIKDFAPQVCLHTAWITTPGIYLNSPSNYSFLKSSLDFIKQAVNYGVQNVIVTGTCIEYRPSNTPLIEDKSPVEPETIYAKCKHQLHRELLTELEKMNCRLCWTRIFYPYGIGEHPDRLCSFIIKKLINNKKVLLNSPLSTKDYIYIDDIAEALLTLVEKQFSGTANIGTGEGITVREIAGLISTMLDKNGLIEENNQNLSIDYTVADITKLKNLGWKQKISIKEGLNRLINYYRQS